jgi:hypothetical protein
VNLVSDNLFATVTRLDGKVSIVFEGKSDRQNPGEIISPWSAKVVPTLSGLDVDVDFRGLKYLNSSSFMPIFKMLSSTRDIADNVHVRYDGSVNWQRLSFASLETISKAWPNLRLSNH